MDDIETPAGLTGRRGLACNEALLKLAPVLLAGPDVDHPEALVGRARNVGDQTRRRLRSQPLREVLVLLPAGCDVLHERERHDGQDPTRTFSPALGQDSRVEARSSSVS